MSRSPAARLLADAGPTVDVRTAARVLGISRGLAYQLIGRGEWPTRVLTLGTRKRIPTADLAREVGIDPPGIETAPRP